MRKLSEIAFGVMAALFAAMAGPASAATYIATYTGTVFDGTDGDGLFGATGADLAGKEFVLQFTFDITEDTKWARKNSDRQVAYSGLAHSGQGEVNSNLISALFKLSDVTISVDDEIEGRIYQANDYGTGQDAIYHVVRNASGHRLTGSVYSFTSDFLESADPISPLAYSVQPGDDYTFGSGFTLSGSTYGTLQINSVTIAQQAAVPEPSTWAMLLLGFFAMGGMLRRRQQGGAVRAAVA